MKPIYGLVLAALILESAVAAETNATRLAVGRVRGFPGRVSEVPVTFASTGQVTAMQFDLTHRPDQIVGGALGELSPRLANHVVRSNTLSPGHTRYVVYARNLAPLPTNVTVGKVPFAVPAKNFTGGDIEASRAIASTPAGAGVRPLRVINGGVHVTPVLPAANGTVDFFLVVERGQTYVVQISEDLVRWTSVATNTPVENYIAMEDPAARGRPHRFYRAVLLSQLGDAIGSVMWLDGGRLSFAFPARAQTRYVLECSTNLMTWQAIATNVASAATISWTNALDPAAPSKFFRVRGP